jgi:hypothetical protein
LEETEVEAPNPDIDPELRQLESQLGEALGAELRPPAAEVPQAADRAVMAAIATRSAEVRRELARRGRRLWPAWAAAAALLMAAGIWASVAIRGSRLPGDLDGSGGVDIVDAYLLAKRLQAAEDLGAELDLTGDGKVDDADVDAVARRAVSVSEEPGK